MMPKIRWWMLCNQAIAIQLELQLLLRYLIGGMAGQQKPHRLKLTRRLFLQKYSWLRTPALDLSNDDCAGLGFEVPSLHFN